jgi:UDP-MurNAc hydroxylase
MKVKYIYSACIEIDCDGFKILTDPWFTPGAFDGSWHQFPKVDPFKYISKPDIIYISHIHPDHYDPVFLKELIKKYGDIPIFIPDLNPNYLLFKSKSDGLNLIPKRYFKNDFVEIFIEENDTGSPSDIDSALIVKDLKSDKLLLNLNDCIFNEPHIEKLKTIISDTGNKLDFLALGYIGAGPYPQTYIDQDQDRNLLLAEAEKKKINFFERYKEYTESFPAKYNLPFAGEYILGGKLSHLNKYRGDADAFEVKQFDDKAVILSNGGYIDLNTNEVFNARNAPYSQEDFDERVNSIKDNLLDYEKEINIPFKKINFMRLLKQASTKAQAKSELIKDYHFIFSVLDESSNVCQKFDLNAFNGDLSIIGADTKVKYSEYSEIKIDFRYFYGLLTTVYHWNNAEVGSLYFTTRVPLENYNADAQKYLNFLSTA